MLSARGTSALSRRRKIALAKYDVGRLIRKERKRLPDQHPVQGRVTDKQVSAVERNRDRIDQSGFRDRSRLRVGNVQRRRSGRQARRGVS